MRWRFMVIEPKAVNSECGGRKGNHGVLLR
jgi:hypothetical protein